MISCLRDLELTWKLRAQAPHLTYLKQTEKSHFHLLKTDGNFAQMSKNTLK